ncbi:L-histidine N(alpha)-methyltransferase [Planctomycetota bacterium]
MSEQASPNSVVDAFLSDVLSGLSQSPKTLPCKYLYDERGSELFEQICELDEYYPTRTELQIVEQNVQSITYQIDKQVMLVEYGSGSSVKTRLILDALTEPVAYVPVDISEEHLLKTAEQLRSAYPDIEILPLVADFTKPFALPKCAREYSHVALYFPGSTIGNFTPAAAGELLEIMSAVLGPQGGLLIGIDLQKDVSVIEAAYNDSAGVTAEFNLNLLTRINSELGGTFDVEQFEHKAVYNADLHRMEISIVSLCEQRVRIGDVEFAFRRNEEILTEYSHKYSVKGFADFAEAYGFSLHQQWTDERNYFAVLHLVLNETKS